MLSDQSICFPGKEAEGTAELPLPSAINQARLDASARLAEGHDIHEGNNRSLMFLIQHFDLYQTVRHDFSELAKVSILDSMRRLKTRLAYSEDLSESTITFDGL